MLNYRTENLRRQAHGNIGAGTHRNANVCFCQGRRVVNAVAGHRDNLSLLLQPIDQGQFALRFDLALDLADAMTFTFGPCPAGLYRASRKTVNIDESSVWL
jgi:hypothetical protein